KAMHVEFGKVIKTLADARGNELTSSQLHEAFEQEYLQQEGPLMLDSFHSEDLAEPHTTSSVACTARLRIDGVLRTVHAQGNGPIDAFVRALNQNDIASFTVLSYSEHSLSQGAEAQAA